MPYWRAHPPKYSFSQIRLHTLGTTKTQRGKAATKWNSPPKLGGVPFARFVANGRGGSLNEPPRLRPSKVASRHSLDGAATPPNLGGELARLENQQRHEGRASCESCLPLIARRSAFMSLCLRGS